MAAFLRGGGGRVLRLINGMHGWCIYREGMDTSKPGRPWMLLAPALALCLLAAHFHRAGSWPLVAATLLVLGLMLASRHAWVPRLVQACLMAATAEWLWTAFVLAQQRQSLGQPWLRMLLILGTVALLTATSAAVFSQRRVRRYYGLP